jgi:hypothetical protein
MKTILPILFVLACSGAYAQDTVKMRRIDSLVLQINTSTLPTHTDTIVQDRPELGLKMTSYLSAIVNGNELIKYVNYVNATRVEDGITKQMIASNSFYYIHNNLIKVEEYVLEGDKKKILDWYYWDDQPLYYTLKSDKAKDRADLLLTMAKGMVKQIIK